ncbi:MAG: porphobilinogen synthase [Thermodesulfobacteriota bacterium]
MRYPQYRPRRLRAKEALRRLVRETALEPQDLIYPLFVVPGKSIRREIPSLPGQCHLSVDRLGDLAQQIRSLGILGVILFGIPSRKDPLGSEAYDPDGIVQRAVAELKEAAPELLVITDVCLCEYTEHGHCGVVRDGDVENDPSLELLAKTAVSHARAGADMVAPSDMMDGRVRAIREALDAEGFQGVPILSYAAKYCSSFYGPFREAAESAPRFGDRTSYQMDPPNWREALREVALDIEEGADIVMVKPAMPYLDVITRVRQQFNHPVAAYQVSGEFAMIHAAARLGWLDGQRAMLEALVGIKRAGADFILSYAAPEVARILEGK